MMDFLNRLFGQPTAARPAPSRPYPPVAGRAAPASDDEQALRRYRYLVQTAPPETIEQAHTEAFAKLTPAQREQVLRELTAQAPASERAALAGAQPDPATLARAATRAEMRQPGFMERSFGGAGGGLGMGGMMAGSILTGLAAGVVGSMVAQQFMASTGDWGMAEGADPGAEAAAEDEMVGFDDGGDGGEMGDDF